jgi:hypothetical protein
LKEPVAFFFRVDPEDKNTRFLQMLLKICQSTQHHIPQPHNFNSYISQKPTRNIFMEIIMTMDVKNEHVGFEVSTAVVSQPYGPS